jgi:nucleoside-diphosphate-sugar epimerase
VTFEGVTALVTGGEGFIGSVLARRLRESGAMVRVLARDPTRQAEGHDLVLGDVTLAPTVLEATRNCELVFHCAASGGGALGQARAVHVDGTRHVMESALQNYTVRRVVHLSSVAAHGSHLPRVVDENQPLVSTGDAYSVTKAEGERVARSYNGRKGLEVVVVRPTCVYGPGSPTWVVNPFQRVRDERALLVGGGAGVINLIYVGDLVELLLLAATSPQAPGESFFASGRVPVKWGDYLGALAQMQGKPPPGSVPFWLAPILASAYLWRFRFTRKVGKLSWGDVEQQRSRTIFRIDKARELLGFEPRVGFEDGMRLTEVWLRDAGYLAGGNLRAAPGHQASESTIDARQMGVSRQ